MLQRGRHSDAVTGDRYAMMKAPAVLDPMYLEEGFKLQPERTQQAAFSTLQIGIGDAGETVGGAERVFSELEAHLPSAGFSVCSAVVSGSVDGDASRAHRHILAAPGDGFASRMLSVRRRISALIEGQAFDLVASHFALYTLPMLDKLRRYPLVVHFHGPWAAESQQEGAGAVAVSVKRAVERIVYRQADCAIVLSKAFANVLSEVYGVPEERIRVVPGSVDTARFAVRESREEARNRLGWPRDRPILVAVRRLSQRMGLDLLIDAVEQVRKREKDVLLLIGGRGALREALEDRVRERNLQEHVRFLGFVSEVELPFVYRAADMNLVPTRAWEGFGLVAAEALAAGTPSMVTPVGGLPEIVRPLAPQLVLRSASVADIADGILQWLTGRLPIPDAEACRAYAAAHFASSVMAERTAAVYRELLHA